MRITSVGANSTFSTSSTEKDSIFVSSQYIKKAKNSATLNALAVSLFTAECTSFFMLLLFCALLNSMCVCYFEWFFFIFVCIFFWSNRTCVLRVTQSLNISPSHPELPPAELFSFAYKLLRVFCFLVFFQFYMRKITLTTVRVTIRPDLPHLATAPSVRPPLRNTRRRFVNKHIPLQSR